jgi:hypothetical protein
VKLRSHEEAFLTLRSLAPEGHGCGTQLSGSAI